MNTKQSLTKAKDYQTKMEVNLTVISERLTKLSISKLNPAQTKLLNQALDALGRIQ